MEQKSSISSWFGHQKPNVTLKYLNKNLSVKELITNKKWLVSSKCNDSEANERLEHVKDDELSTRHDQIECSVRLEEDLNKITNPLVDPNSINKFLPSHSKLIHESNTPTSRFNKNSMTEDFHYSFQTSFHDTHTNSFEHSHASIKHIKEFVQNRLNQDSISKDNFLKKVNNNKEINTGVEDDKETYKVENESVFNSSECRQDCQNRECFKGKTYCAKYYNYNMEASTVEDQINTGSEKIRMLTNLKNSTNDTVCHWKHMQQVSDIKAGNKRVETCNDKKPSNLEQNKNSLRHFSNDFKVKDYCQGKSLIALLNNNPNDLKRNDISNDLQGNDISNDLQGNDISNDLQGNDKKSDFKKVKEVKSLLEDTKVVRCQRCLFQGKYQKDIKEHTEICHPTCNCSMCNFKAESSEKLLNHLSENHPTNNFYNANLPNQSLVNTLKKNRLDIVNSHVNKTSDSKSLECQIKKNKKLRKYSCKQCSFSTTIQKDIWTHTKTHVPASKLLSCPHCPFVCAFKHHMQYHLNNHFGFKPFRCHLCTYRCNNKSMLNSHLKSHSAEYPYKCNKCPYVSKYKQALYIHAIKMNHGLGACEASGRWERHECKEEKEIQRVVDGRKKNEINNNGRILNEQTRLSDFKFNSSFEAQNSYIPMLSRDFRNNEKDLPDLIKNYISKVDLNHSQNSRKHLKPHSLEHLNLFSDFFLSQILPHPVSPSSHFTSLSHFSKYSVVSPPMNCLQKDSNEIGKSSGFNGSPLYFHTESPNRMTHLNNFEKDYKSNIVLDQSVPMDLSLTSRNS